MISYRRRLATLFVLMAALALAPGLARAADQSARTPADDGAVARVIRSIERLWDALTGSTPAAAGALLRCGPGIDPNGTTCPPGGGGGGTTSSNGGG